jgi:ATP-dependent DNA ligase
MPALRAELQALQAAGLPDGWDDGEVVVLGESGVPDFQALQQAFDAAPEAEPAARLVYCFFDAPFHDGQDLRALLQSALAAATAAKRGKEETGNTITATCASAKPSPPARRRC